MSPFLGRTLLPAFFFLAVSPFVVACSSEPATPPTASAQLVQKCVPNQTLVCLCGLDEGTQTCDEAGELSPCDCAPRTMKAPIPPTPPPPPPPPTKPEPKCGDGKVDPGEACDDGNATDGDGCSAACVPDGTPTSASACPGQGVHVWKATPVVLAGTTESFSNTTTAKCWNATGADRIYAIHAEASGVLTLDASFATRFNAVVSVRSGDCKATTSEVLCEDTLSKPFKRVLSVEKGKTYHLIIDGDSATAKGAFAVRLELL